MELILLKRTDLEPSAPFLWARRGPVPGCCERPIRTGPDRSKLRTHIEMRPIALQNKRW